MKRLTAPLITLCFFAFVLGAFATDKKEFKTKRVEDSPRIDGVLDDEAWKEGGEQVQFFQFSPDNGKLSEFKTTVLLAYTDRAIYVAAKMYDPEPDKILKEFGLRDDGDRNADAFGFLIDPYNSGINAFSFFVTAAGVQADFFITGSNFDASWDAVWKSATKVDENGWTIEFEIPYYAIRFPKQEVQHWSVNFYRRVMRKQEESYWNHVDNGIQGTVNQFGTLIGIQNIAPPLRLSFSPYTATIYTNDGAGNNKLSFAGGMDLKYGLNESYTLDMSLIPDFSQVQSDNVVYNISAFEVRFNENRQFFTEGTELFNKSNLFYSRRIGQSFGSVNYDSETEEIVSKPTGANLINATKISGRNKKGLGLGFFNAITNRTYAKVRNRETEETRDVPVDPLTNFNVFVVDQNLKNNSNINFTNTSVIRGDGGRDANVSGLRVSLRDKTNTYQVSSFASVSAILLPEDKTDVGYKYFLELAKISGTWQYGLGRVVESDNYKINDLGFLQAPNEISHYGWLRYSILKPKGIINTMRTTLNLFHEHLYEPNTFSTFQSSLNVNAQFKNFWWAGFNINGRPAVSYDYFEPRESGYYVSLPQSLNFNFWVESDSRKSLQVNGYTGQWHRPEWDQTFRWWGTYLRYRVNNKLSFNTEINYDRGDGRGFATKLYDEDGNLSDIVFGARDVLTTSNIIGLNYTFNNKMGLTLRVRHYWSKVKYEKFFSLGFDGELNDTDYEGLNTDGSPAHDANFNAMNVDLVYFFQIAPGSFLNFVWKDAIQTFTNNTSPDYLTNVRDLSRSPQVNSISLRLTYFIDYLTLKKSISKS
ncbi:MAG: carbohydrate binding family 9 domain-containing protein [Cyclobacteriaceae bacterium]|nr:carbohydrate binding family 9 domain-containing protein [Cyclobacteriaceae bacterium]